MLGIICCDLYTGFCVQNDKASKHLRRSSVAAALISGNITRLDYCQTHTWLRLLESLGQSFILPVSYWLPIFLCLQVYKLYLLPLFLGGNLHFGVTNEYRLRPNKNFREKGIV